MSDEKPVPETLGTIAASIRQLRQSMDSRFDEVASRMEMNARFHEVAVEFGKVDSRFDEVAAQFDKVDLRFEELKAQLRTEIAEVRSQLSMEIVGARSQLRVDIEAVRGDVRLVAEAFGSQAMVNRRNQTAHTRFKKRLDDHDIHIVALERKGSGGSSA